VLLPRRAGLFVVAEGDMRVAEVIEDGGGFGGVACGAHEGEGLLVIADGLLVVAAAVGDVVEAVQGVCLAVGVVVLSWRRTGTPAGAAS
jgi:hypothetical protein